MTKIKELLPHKATPEIRSRKDLHNKKPWQASDRKMDAALMCRGTCIRGQALFRKLPQGTPKQTKARKTSGFQVSLPLGSWGTWGRGYRQGGGCALCHAKGRLHWLDPFPASPDAVVVVLVVAVVVEWGSVAVVVVVVIAAVNDVVVVVVVVRPL